MKLTERIHPETHYLTDETGLNHGELKDFHKNGHLKGHCFSKDGYIYGECKVWNPYGGLTHWTLELKGKQLLCFNQGTGFDNAEEQITKKARELDLPLLSDIPTDEEGRTYFALKHPNMPLLPISEQTSCLPL